VQHKTLKEAIKANKEGKKLTQYKYVGVTKWFDSGQPQTEHYAVRTPVWKRPTEYRDAISVTPSLLYEVWNWNKIVQYSLSGSYKDLYYETTNNPWRFLQERLSFRKHKNNVHVDFKKSGLTMPHWFPEMLLRYIKEINPGIVIDFPVQGWKIFDPKKKRVFL